MKAPRRSLLLRALGHSSSPVSTTKPSAARFPGNRIPNFKRAHSGVSKQQGSGSSTKADRHRPVIPAYKLRLEVRKTTLALERPSASDHHATAVRELWVATPQ